MKIRNDFVTNSSSSSFLISRKAIGEKATVKDVYKKVNPFYEEKDTDAVDCEYQLYTVYDLHSERDLARLGIDDTDRGEIFLYWIGT